MNNDEYIELFKKMSLQDKKNSLEKEMKYTLVFLMNLHEQNGWPAKLILNKEVLDIQNKNSTEEDFIEAMFAYTLSIQEMLASYIELNSKK